jgi:hypothetical protein
MEDLTHFSYHILKVVQERITLTQEAILHGSPKEFVDYRELVGELRGLQFCETEIKELLSRSEMQEN